MGWNYFYNILFESWEARQPRKGRSVLRRIVHAVGFEAGLVAMLVPLFAWVLGVDLLTALMLNAMEGLSHEECAKVLNCSVRGTEGRIYRARQMLLRWWNEEGQ